MTPELLALTLAVLLQAVQFTLYSGLAQKQVGTEYAASPRDDAARPDRHGRPRAAGAE